MKPSKKLSLSVESLRSLSSQESLLVGGGIIGTRIINHCNTDATCVTDCGPSVCASYCNGHYCP